MSTTSNSISNNTTPILIFTGFLGAGKTTILLNFIKQLKFKKKTENENNSMIENDTIENDNTSINACWLKNEFGDIEIDTLLAKENNIYTKEILNGCLCCTLTGRLGDGIVELKNLYSPDLIVIETSGSAYPGPIVWEIRRLISTGIEIKLDAVVCVIDIANFKGYEDTSYTAKLQVKDTDLILINKHELVDDNAYDLAMDDIFLLNPGTPKIKTDKGYVPCDLLLGLTSTIDFSANVDVHHHEEVKVFSLITTEIYKLEEIYKFLDSLEKEVYFRVKGIIVSSNCVNILNWAFGRYETIPLKIESEKYDSTKLTFIGMDMLESKIKSFFKNCDLNIVS